MNASLRELGRQVADVPAPQLDIEALVAAGESQVRRRRLAEMAVVAATVVAVVGGTVLVSPGTHPTPPPPAGPDLKDTAPDLMKDPPGSRLLTYAVGTTIHWGDTTIDVGKPADLHMYREIDYLDATDAGVVFVIGQPFEPDGQGKGGLPYGPAEVWFTDGSAPVRIGTTHGSMVRGFAISPTASGSMLAWVDPGTSPMPGALVVYDTGEQKELARLGEVTYDDLEGGYAGAIPLAVYDDAVFWSPDGTGCDRYLWGAAYTCSSTARVMRFDTASATTTPVSTADYEADRRARPGILTGASDDQAQRRGVMFLGFAHHGDQLVAVGQQTEFTPVAALTGQPIRLRLPARDVPRDDTNPVLLTQWLDADRVVLLDDYDDGTDLVVCQVSTGACAVTLRVADGDFLAPGPAVSHG